MKKLLATTWALLLVFGSVGSAFAYSLADPAPGFGPDQYQNLISDSSFRSVDYQEAEITQFLRKEGQWGGRTGGVSWLANYNIPEYQTVLYKYNDGGTCKWASVSVRQYNDVTGDVLYGMSAAALIAREALQHSINPGVLLATLEKESSAITSTSPLSDAVEKWVLGYGWNDNMAACGYNQTDAQNRAINFGGVGQQIAYSMAWFESRMSTYASSYANTFTSGDGATISARNAATRVLYAYTPYVYNGNYNFWRLFNLWFQNGSRKFSKEAQLIKGSGPEIYAYWPAQNKRWYVESMAAVTAWEIYNTTVTTKTDQQMAAIPVGTGKIERMAKTPDNPAVYYIESGVKFHMKTERLFAHYNLSWDDLGVVDEVLLQQAPTGHPIGMLAKSAYRDEVYIISYGRRYYISNEAMLNNWGYNWGDISNIPQSEIDRYPLAGTLDYLTTIEGNSRTYLITNGQRFYITSSDVMTHWNLNFGMVRPLGMEMSFILPEMRSLSRVAKAVGDPRVYYIQSGRKRYVSSASRLSAVGASINDVVEVSPLVLNRLPTGTNL